MRLPNQAAGVSRQGLRAQRHLSGSKGSMPGPVRSVVPAALPSNSGVPDNECRQFCFDQCVGSPNPVSCRKQCEAQHCKSVGSNPWYTCTMQDNSAQHNACIAAITAWEIAAGAECAAVGNSVLPVLGAVAGGICSWGLHDVANQMRSQCPPSTICV
jgi:hypothetical protein